MSQLCLYGWTFDFPDLLICWLFRDFFFQEKIYCIIGVVVDGAVKWCEAEFVLIVQAKSDSLEKIEDLLVVVVGCPVSYSAVIGVLLLENSSLTQ